MEIGVYGNEALLSYTCRLLKFSTKHGAKISSNV